MRKEGYLHHHPSLPHLHLSAYSHPPIDLNHHHPCNSITSHKHPSLPTSVNIITPKPLTPATHHPPLSLQSIMLFGFGWI